MKIKMSRVGKITHSSKIARKHQAGFSLLEMLVVMSILAFSAGAIFIFYKPGGGANALKTAALKTASRMRDARVAAVYQQSEKRVLIDLNRRFINFGDGKKVLKFDRSINLSVTAAESEQQAASLSGIRFFPNGSSTGGVIKLRKAPHVYEIRVNWLTGRVTTNNVQ